MYISNQLCLDSNDNVTTNSTLTIPDNVYPINNSAIPSPRLSSDSSSKNLRKSKKNTRFLNR
jgi:hypothetical protein